MATNLWKNIPSVSELLDQPPLKGLVQSLSRNMVVSRAKSFLTNVRDEITGAAADLHLPRPQEVAEQIARWILRERRESLRPVINATGILLHPALTAPPLAEQAIAEMQAVASGFAAISDGETDVEADRRQRPIERLLREAAGAEAAIALTNDAAAMTLALAALAKEHEVLVARGEVVEFGADYRIASLAAAAGARLREVGSSNRARPAAFEEALGEASALVLRVAWDGAAASQRPTLGELAAMTRRRQIPLLVDLGRGGILDVGRMGLSGIPFARKVLDEGADLVLLRGDQLLGGPPCGILAGRSELVERLLRHPLMAALRLGPLGQAALTATLRLYGDEQSAEESIPVLSLLSTSMDNLKLRAERLAVQLQATAAVAEAAVQQGTVTLAGDPDSPSLPTWRVRLKPAADSAAALAARLRRGSPAVVGCVEGDALLLDLRSVLPRQDAELVDAVAALDPRREEEPPAEGTPDASAADSPPPAQDEAGENRTAANN